MPYKCSLLQETTLVQHISVPRTFQYTLLGKLLYFCFFQCMISHTLMCSIGLHVDMKIYVEQQLDLENNFEMKFNS